MESRQELNQLIKSHRTIRLAKYHLAKLEARLEEENLRLQGLEQILEEEYEDLQEFDQLNIINLFHRLLGNSEAKHEILQQEYLYAFLQHRECKKSIELMLFEKEVLAEKIEAEKGIEAKITELIRDREGVIGKQYPKIRSKLISIDQQLDVQFDYLRELRETISRCLEIQQVFGQMSRSLEKVKSSALWSLQHEKINRIHGVHLEEAQECFYQARQLLLKLDDDLEDIYAFKAIGRWNKFEELKYFNHIYYDRLISDWVVKGQIDSTLHYLDGIIDSVDRISKTLETQMERTDKKIERLEMEKDELIQEELK